MLHKDMRTRLLRHGIGEMWVKREGRCGGEDVGLGLGKQRGKDYRGRE